MSLENPPSVDKNPVDKKSKTSFELIKVTTIAYSLMAFVGFEICWWYHKNVLTLFGPIQYDAKRVVAMVVASVLFLHFCQRSMEDFFPSYKKFKLTLATMFKGLSWPGAAWLALMSSIAEEILFRGSIQPFLGLWFTSALFGLLHLDPDGGISIWTVWAVLAGIIMGSTVIVTGSLWPAIMIHFVVNFIGIMTLTRIKSKSPRVA